MRKRAQPSFGPDEKPLWCAVLARLEPLLVRGAKADLARHVGVTSSMMSKYIGRIREPAAEVALGFIDWIERREK